MPYATLADVLDAAPKLNIGANTKPSVEDAQAIIQAVENHVSGNLKSLGYTLPIDKTTSPKSFITVRDIVVQGSLARILKAMYYGVRDPEDVGANDAYREFQSKLKALADPEDPFSLEDAPLADYVQKVSSELASSGIDPSIDESLIVPRMTRLQVF